MQCLKRVGTEYPQINLEEERWENSSHWNLCIQLGENVSFWPSIIDHLWKSIFLHNFYDKFDMNIAKKKLKHFSTRRAEYPQRENSDVWCVSSIYVCLKDFEKCQYLPVPPQPWFISSPFQGYHNDQLVSSNILKRESQAVLNSLLFYGLIDSSSWLHAVCCHSIQTLPGLLLAMETGKHCHFSTQSSYWPPRTVTHQSVSP